MKVHQFHIPTSLYLGPVNVHLIDEDPLTLVDTGPNYPAALDALEDAFHSVGRRLEELERIVVTHMHEDHFGLAGHIQRESGAAIFAHPWEAGRLRGFDDYHLYVPLLEQAGVSPEAIRAFGEGFRELRKLGEELQEVEGIEDGDHIDFERGSFEVIHTPGHTPGSISLFRAADRSLIASDTVLKHITPNPILSPDPLDASRRFPSLGEYLVSLSRLRALAPTVVHGGHGPDVTDFERYFADAVKLTDERQRKIGALLPDEGATPWELCFALFPDAKGAHRFLALSEAVAHLDFGVSEGRFARREEGDADRFVAIRGVND
jgi:glyoxylase-like metal-dependent hydrolase (beta-lactamase superfamily II)